MVAKVVSYDESAYKAYKRLTCYNCRAIIQYAPIDVKWEVDYYLGGGGNKIRCPACNYPNGVS